MILFVPDYFRVRRCTEPAPPGSADIEVVTFDTSIETADTIEDKLERLGNEEMAGGTGLMAGSARSRDVLRDICNSYMEVQDDLDELRRSGRVDMVLVDGTRAAHCLSLIPAYLGAPFVAFGSYIEPFDSASPLPTSYYPAPLSALSSNMGFFQRLTNFLYYAYRAWNGELWGDFHQGNSLGVRVGRLDHHVLIKKAAIYLENSDCIVDYPKATFPNFVQVGGLTASPAKPLPGPLKKFFDGGADTGVVVVSLGTYVFNPNKNLEDKLLTAFRRLDTRILLRLNASRSVTRLKNLQTVSWFPQNDALGHPNTKVFVSLCGQNSFFEALYHGVPMLCCHFAGSDVLGTGARVAEYGVGLSIDLLAASPDSVLAAISTLLTDKSFTRRVKAASKLFRSRSESAVQRAAGAVEHVLKFGGGYLRPRTVEMNFFQYAGLDVALALFTFILAAAAAVGFVVWKHLPQSQQVPKAKEVNEAANPASGETPATKTFKSDSDRGHPVLATCVALLVIILFYVVV